MFSAFEFLRRDGFDARAILAAQESKAPGHGYLSDSATSCGSTSSCTSPVGTGPHRFIAYPMVALPTALEVTGGKRSPSVASDSPLDGATSATSPMTSTNSVASMLVRRQSDLVVSPLVTLTTTTTAAAVSRPAPALLLPSPSAPVQLSTDAMIMHRNVYISGLPWYMQSNEFRELCLRFGRVEASKLCVEGPSNPTKGYGFVLYYTEESAAACIAGLSGSYLNGRCLQARLADTHATPKDTKRRSQGGAGRSHNTNSNSRNAQSNSSSGFPNAANVNMMATPASLSSPLSLPSAPFPSPTMPHAAAPPGYSAAMESTEAAQRYASLAAVAVAGTASTAGLTQGLVQLPTGQLMMLPLHRPSVTSPVMYAAPYMPSVPANMPPGMQYVSLMPSMGGYTL